MPMLILDNGQNYTAAGHKSNFVNFVRPYPIFLFNGQTESSSFTHSYPTSITSMPKVFIPSPAPISRRKFSRVEYIISHKQALTIWSKPTLLLQRKRKRLGRPRHGCTMLTPHPSPLFIDNIPRHPVAHDIQSTKASALAEYTNVIRGGANSHQWSPTVLGKRKKSPAPVSFYLSSRKTLLQLKDQPNVLQLFPSGQEEAPSKLSYNEVTCHQQPRLQSDSSALREWIASIVFEFALRKDQRHQPRLPVYVVHRGYVMCHPHNSLKCQLGVSRRLLRLVRTLSGSLRSTHYMMTWFFWHCGMSRI